VNVGQLNWELSKNLSRKRHPKKQQGDCKLVVSHVTPSNWVAKKKTHANKPKRQVPQNNGTNGAGDTQLCVQLNLSDGLADHDMEDSCLLNSIPVQSRVWLLRERNCSYLTAARIVAKKKEKLSRK